MADAAADRYTATGRMIRKSALGRKLGMTQVFDENGMWIGVTVLEAGPCTVLQVKTPEKDGYFAFKVGFGKRKRPSKPLTGLCAKLGVEPPQWIKEIPLVEASAVLGASEDKKDVGPGDRFGVGLFAGVARVDVGGISKGKGFQGVIKRHHFNAGPKSRGTKNIRESGSTGMHTEPGRVLKGKKMPGHLGAVPRKARNLLVVKIDAEKNLLLVRGAVPGPSGGLVYIEESLRKK